MIKIILIVSGIFSVACGAYFSSDVTQVMLKHLNDVHDLIPGFESILFFLNFFQISVLVFGTLALMIYAIKPTRR